MLAKNMVAALMGAALVGGTLASEAAHGGIDPSSYGTWNNCSHCPSKTSPGSATLRKYSLRSQAAAQLFVASANNQAATSQLGGETLVSQLAGDWEQVFGAITYINPHPGADEDFYVVGINLPAYSTGDDQYDVPGWHREGFFIDAGDGVQRLVAARLLDPEFTPDFTDTLTESGQLWLSEFVLYQEGEELERDPNFYDNYPDGASASDLTFVTDVDGKVLDIAIDIYDEFQQYLYTVPMQAGDRYNPGTTLYDLDEPDFVYLNYFFDELQDIDDGFELKRDYVVPSAENDPALAEGFDSAQLDLFLILEGARETVENDAEFGYSTPVNLGYTWGQAKSAATGGGGASGSPVAATVNAGALAPASLLLFGLGLLPAGIRRWRRGAR